MQSILSSRVIRQPDDIILWFYLSWLLLSWKHETVMLIIYSWILSVFQDYEDDFDDDDGDGDSSKEDPEPELVKKSSTKPVRFKPARDINKWMSTAQYTWGLLEPFNPSMFMALFAASETKWRKIENK